MKFCTFRRPDGSVLSGFLQDGLVVDMHAHTGGRLPKTMLEFLMQADDNLIAAREAAASLARQAVVLPDPDRGIYKQMDIEFLAPLPRPSSIRDFYAFEAHVQTARRNRGLDMVPQWYHFPVFYFTNHQSVMGPEDSVRVPPECEWFDYELEIACVIGRTGRDIAASSASDYVFGYTIMNDWSARDLQREEMKVGLGPAKGKDFATSLGPWIVTPDELEKFLPHPPLHRMSPEGDPLLPPPSLAKRYQLEMSASVNGVVLSKGNYKDIYFPFEQMIERASRGVTLYPGDVLGSGTVGTGCILELGTKIHRWLQPGDVVELKIDGLGTLRNTVEG